jgi:hypothetical protein
MKNVIAILLILLGCTKLGAQETIAKFKYEDAEKAFVAENYQECIDNLIEAEKLLGKTAPNILHLKILAQYKLIAKDPFESFERLESLHHDCTTYIRDYDIAGLEEKYRDVYEVQDAIKDYPKTQAEYTAAMERQKQEIKTVFENYIDALGGREALGNVKNLHIKGEQTMAGATSQFEDKIMPGKKSRAIYYQVRKNKKQLLTKMVTTENGAFVVDMNGNKKVMEDDRNGMPIQGLFHELELTDLLDDPNYRFKLVQSEDGRSHSVQVKYLNEDKQEPSVVWYAYDATTHLPISKSFHYYDNGTDIGYTLTKFGDFRAVNGITLPFSKEVTSVDKRAKNTPQPTAMQDMATKLAEQKKRRAMYGSITVKDRQQAGAPSAKPQGNDSNVSIQTIKYKITEILINQGVALTDFE